MNTSTRATVAVVATVIIAMVAGAGPALASKSPAKQASEQVNRGYKAAKSGYWQEALFRFERANELTPNDPRVLNNIAVALEASGRFEEAMVAYQTALAVAPNDRVLRENYSRFKEFYETQVLEPRAEEDEKAASDTPPSDEAADKESDDA